MLKGKIPDEFMNQAHPIDSLVRQIKDLEAVIDATNKVRLSKSDRDVQTEHRETVATEVQTDIGKDYFDHPRPKSRSSGGVSKPGTPRHHPSASLGGDKTTFHKAQISLEDASFGVSETYQKAPSSSKSKGLGTSPKSDLSRNSHTLDVGSKHSSHSNKREVEDPTPIIMRSVYKHDTPHSSLHSHDRSLSNDDPVSRDQPKPTHSRLPSIHQAPRGPPPDIKSYIRQAVSRRKDDFEDLP